MELNICEAIAQVISQYTQSKGRAPISAEDWIEWERFHNLPEAKRTEEVFMNLGEGWARTRTALDIMFGALEMSNIVENHKSTAMLRFVLVFHIRGLRDLKNPMFGHLIERVHALSTCVEALPYQEADQLHKMRRANILAAANQYFPDYLSPFDVVRTQPEFRHDVAYLVQEGLLEAEELDMQSLGRPPRFEYGEPRLTSAGVRFWENCDDYNF